MADYEGYEYDEEEFRQDDNITQEDCWEVITAYFETKGLVSQQIDSFNDFQSTTIQELIDEYSHLSLDENNPPPVDGREIAVKRYEIKLGGITISRPVIHESDATSAPLLPYECRDRNLTYASPIYVKMDTKVSACIEEPVPSTKWTPNNRTIMPRPVSYLRDWLGKRSRIPCRAPIHPKIIPLYLSESSQSC